MAPRLNHSTLVGPSGFVSTGGVGGFDSVVGGVVGGFVPVVGVVVGGFLPGVVGVVGGFVSGGFVVDPGLGIGMNWAREAIDMKNRKRQRNEVFMVTN